MVVVKKIIVFILTVLIISSLVTPAFATENSFVPSITYKPEPEIKPVEDENGEEKVAIVRNEQDEIVSYIDDGCLRITPIAHVWDDSIDVPVEVDRLLRFVYNNLNEGTMELPYEKFDEGLNSQDMVIRDLFDARWYCEEHPEMVAPDGVLVELTFDLGVPADTEIFVMTYDEETEEWEPIVSTVNNGDGTVTCTFEHLCAIAFAMPLTTAVVPESEASATDAMMWIAILVAAAIAVIALLIAKNKKETVKK